MLLRGNAANGGCSRGKTIHYSMFLSSWSQDGVVAVFLVSSLGVPFCFVEFFDLELTHSTLKASTEVPNLGFYPKLRSECRA